MIIRSLRILIGVSVAAAIFFTPIDVQAIEIKENIVVDKYKIWTISFNQEVALEDNLDKITIVDSKGNIIKNLKVDLGEDGKIIKIAPPSEGYTSGENYMLSITEEFQNKNNEKLGEKVIAPFSVGNTVRELHAFYPSGITYGPKTDAFIKSVDSISLPWSSLSFDEKAPEKFVRVSLHFDEKNIGSDNKNMLKQARDYGKSVQLSIFADDNSPSTYKIISTLLPYKEKREALINNILHVLETGINIGEEQLFKFDGIVIDFEGLRNENINGKTISEFYVEFIEELKAKLASLEGQKKLYSAVNVSTNYNGYDYSNIIKHVDKLILMAHDYEPTGNITKNDIMKYTNYNENNHINSLAPINQVEEALKLTVDGLYGEALKKVYLQISMDSGQWQFKVKDVNDWTNLDGNTFSIGHFVPTYSKINERFTNNIDTVKLESGYIDKLQSPYIAYYNNSSETYNFIIFEDGRSVKAKIDTANKYGIGGISIWQWGNVPDFDNEIGKKYYLDVWQQILKAVK